MSEKIVQLNEEVIKGEIRELVRGSVEETLNELLEAEADKLTRAARYARSEERQGYRSGHYSRGLTTTSGEVTLNVPRLKGISFETAIIERYRRRDHHIAHLDVVGKAAAHTGCDDAPYAQRPYGFQGIYGSWSPISAPGKTHVWVPFYCNTLGIGDKAREFFH